MIFAAPGHKDAIKIMEGGPAQANACRLQNPEPTDLDPDRSSARAIRLAVNHGDGGLRHRSTALLQALMCMEEEEEERDRHANVAMNTNTKVSTTTPLS